MNSDSEEMMAKITAEIKTDIRTNREKKEYNRAQMKAKWWPRCKPIRKG
jgi:hypothetical protein